MSERMYLVLFDLFLEKCCRVRMTVLYCVLDKLEVHDHETES
jgi:hypothetical protein